jgi:RNA polymerase sigma factor (sigma-70 family)
MSVAVQPKELRLRRDLAWLVVGEVRPTITDGPVLFRPRQRLAIPWRPRLALTEPQRFFARYEDGSHPIEDFGTRVKVYWPTGACEYSSHRAAIGALTGHPKARNWTWERYLGLGRHRPARTRSSELLEVTIFDAFAGFEESSRLTTAAGTVLIRPPTLGIDLTKRGHEVKKLLFAGFGAQIYASGYDADDVLQEVYKGILVRNNGKCPFDARKASFGHYVHLVCSCIVKNFHRRMSRMRAVEPTASEDDELAMSLAESGQGAESENFAADDLSRTLSDVSGPFTPDAQSLARRVLPYVRAGYSRAEIAEELGLAKPVVSRALAEIRETAREWTGQRYE